MDMVKILIRAAVRTVILLDREEKIPSGAFHFFPVCVFSTIHMYAL